MFPPCIKILVRDSDISDNRHQHRHFPIKSLNIFSRPSTSLAAFFCAVCVDRPHAEVRFAAFTATRVPYSGRGLRRAVVAVRRMGAAANCAVQGTAGVVTERFRGAACGAACRRSGQLRASAGQRLRPAQFCELQFSEASISVYGFAAWRIFPHFGRMPMKNSAFMRGIGRPSTDRYSSLKRLLTVAFSVRSAHPNAISRSSDTLLI